MIYSVGKFLCSNHSVCCDSVLDFTMKYVCEALIQIGNYSIRWRNLLPKLESYAHTRLAWELSEFIWPVLFAVYSLAIVIIWLKTGLNGLFSSSYKYNTVTYKWIVFCWSTYGPFVIIFILLANWIIGRCEQGRNELKWKTQLSDNSRTNLFSLPDLFAALSIWIFWERKIENKIYRIDCEISKTLYNYSLNLCKGNVTRIQTDIDQS